jgi:hypothetical protein
MMLAIAMEVVWRSRELDVVENFKVRMSRRC